jgi:threonylcarbamoyladenosine tRNA methylthiotransferase MtaB
VKIFLDSIGCRLNQAEIEEYALQFRLAGHILVANPGEADLAVINTCTVTGAADADSRQKIRQAAHAGIEEVIVTGCWATLNPQEAAALPSVHQVVTNARKGRLVIDLLNLPLENFDREPVERQPIPGVRLRTRAFIKVQDGCDNHCTYCIAALARGAACSRPIASILTDLNRLQGIQEAVLTGVHLGSWGQDLSPSLHLRQLVQAILKETSIPRLRLSSLEPWNIQADFFELWQDSRLCRQLHLPLQSGCAATLHRMARKTTPEAFAELVEAARATIPNVAITTDVIAGFPGETQAEFDESLNFVRQMHFADGHVFTYSARPGTAAARMPGQVPQAIRKERNAHLCAVMEECARGYRMGFVGQVLSVLWESTIAHGSSGWEMSGLTSNYLRVQAQAPDRLWNQITPVKITTITPAGLKGVIQ